MTPRSINSTDKLIAYKLKLFRKDSKLTQEELAKKLNISFQQIQKYERGVNRIPASRLFQIANIFEIDIRAFFGEVE